MNNDNNCEEELKVLSESVAAIENQFSNHISDLQRQILNNKKLIALAIVTNLPNLIKAIQVLLI